LLSPLLSPLPTPADPNRPMQRTPSKPKAALWMSGWLTLTLVIAIAAREATRELNVFQLMEVRSLLGFVLLYPIIHFNGGLAIVKRRASRSMSRATSFTTAHSFAGSSR